MLVMACLIGCQVCLTRFKWIGDFRDHIKSRPHREKMTEVFQIGNNLKHTVVIPYIAVLELHKQKTTPIVGISLLTFCFSPVANACFYLCHACEEKCELDRITNHLLSGDHYSKYFSYTDPDRMAFSWIPTMDMKKYLMEELSMEAKARGPGLLQVLDLPVNLVEMLITRKYSEVMSTLSENDELLKQIKAAVPKRMMAQTYQRDCNRKHPLLGMQHIIECISVGSAEKRHYLCTLCQLSIGIHMIIKHVLSFDHLYRYFRAWHPSTLLSKECYLDYNSLVSLMLDFAKQTEEIHITTNTAMKQVSLEPDKFKSVNFACYAEALKELESITKEKDKDSSLITDIKPGNKLAQRTFSKKSVIGPLPYKVRCQECDLIFGTIEQYSKHLSAMRHKQTLKKCFDNVESADDHNQKGCWTVHFGLYDYLKNSWEQNEHVIGVSLVVIFVCTQVSVEPFYLCFACEECFLESSVRQHFNSHKHLVLTLLYQNPWRLPFGWENPIDVQLLKSMAREEEKERGPQQMTLKVFDLPDMLFKSLLQEYSHPHPYPKVMTSLDRYHTLLRREVPQRETYSKLEENERFPLLGEQFLVMHSACGSGIRFLCLLCKRKLEYSENCSHVFSREHVSTFIDCFHPGSLSPSFDMETLLDLAKQAARIHPITHVQVIDLNWPIYEPYSYTQAIKILHCAKVRSKQGDLEPPITPKMKLVPRGILKEMDMGQMKNGQENSQMMQGSEKQTSQKPTDQKVTTTTCGAERCRNVKTEIAEETPASSEKTNSEEVKKEGSETYQLIKEGKIEEPARNASEENPHCCQNTDQTDEAEIAKEKGKSWSKDGQSQLKKCIYKETKRSRRVSVSEKSDQEMLRKRQLLNPKEDSSAEGQKTLPNIKREEEETTEEEQSGKASHGTVNDEATCDVTIQPHLWQYIKMKSRGPVIGLCSLIECHCYQRDPIYLCECCRLKIQEKDIVSHITGADHQQTYLVGLQKLSPGKHMGTDLRSVAALFEHDHGYGEAQVVDLDKETFSNILKQTPQSAIHTVKAFLAQQSSCHELPPTSAVQSVDSSVTLHAQHNDLFSTDNLQVVDMEIDGSHHPEAQQSSSTAALTETTERRPESNEDVKMTGIKVSESAFNVNTCLTISKTNEYSCVSTSGTNATRLKSDFFGSSLKAEINPNTPEGALKPDAPSKIAKTLQNATNSAVTKSHKSATATSTCAARSPSSISDATKLTVTTTSGTTAAPAASTSRQTASERMATNSNATITTSKLTAANDIPSAASKVDKTVKHSEAASQSVVKSAKCAYAEVFPKTAHVQNSLGPKVVVGPNVPKNSSPAAPHLTALVSVRSENQNPSTQPSHVSMNKTKPSDSLPKVGLNHLIVVACESRQQVFCRLCSVRVIRSGSSHLLDHNHKYNYVKMMCPGWAATPSQMERFDKIVARLAELERDVGSRIIQKLEVKTDVYSELRYLPDVKALERLKEMLRQRDSSKSSASTADTGQVVSTSPCEASSSDGDVLHSEIESVSKAVRNPSVGQSNRVQRLKSSEPKADDLTSSYQSSVPTLREKNPEPIVSPRIQAADTAAVQMDKIDGWMDPPVTDSEVTGRPGQTSAACQEAAELRQHQERSRPELQDSKKVPEGTQKTSPVSLNPDTLPSAADTGPQNQSRPNHKSAHIPKHSGRSPEPGSHSASQAFSGTLVGQKIRGPSHMSTFLSVQGLDNQPIIGLGSVWECRGIRLDSFFLCESCEVTLSIKFIHDHMISTEHQYKYLCTKPPQFLHFMAEDLLPCMKKKIFDSVIHMLSKQERYSKKDAQVLLLRQDLYEYIRTAPFSEALRIVQYINEEPNPSVFCPPVSTVQLNDQQHYDQQHPEESLDTEKQSTPAPEADQRGRKDTTQKTERPHLEESVVVADVNEDKRRNAFTPLVVNSVSSKAGTDTCHSPQENSGSISMKPKKSPPASRHQSPVPELQGKQEEVHSESTSSHIVSQKDSQPLPVCPGDKCPPTRKRPAISPDTSCQLTGPLPAKSRCTSLQPVRQVSMESTSNSTPINPPATATLLPLKDEDPGLKSEEQDAGVHWERCARLKALLRKMRSERSMSTSPPCSDNATTSCPDSRSENGVERGRDSKHVQTTSAKTSNNKSAKWDSKTSVFKATVKSVPSPPNSMEGKVSTAAPVVSKPIPLNVIETEAEEVCARMPSISTAGPSDPPNQRVDTLGKPSRLHFVATNQNTAVIPQPQAHTETCIAGNDPLPINRIITPRPDDTTQHLMGTSNGGHYVDVNSGPTFAHSFSAGTAANPRDAVAAAGNYGQSIQVAYPTNGKFSGYLSPESVAYNRPPDNHHTHTGNLYKQEGCSRMPFYPSHVYPEQRAGHYVSSLATPTPPGCSEQVIQQQVMQLQAMQQQQYYSPCTNADLAAVGGMGTNQAAYSGSAPFYAPANTPQMFMNSSNYGVNAITPTQNNHPIAHTDTDWRVQFNPAVAHYPPAGEVKSHTWHL